MKKCLYCGNNPVPHSVNKFYESFDILVSPIRRLLVKSAVGQALEGGTTLVALGMYKALKPTGLIKFNRELKEIKYDRARVLWEEALARNIFIEEIKPFNQSIDLYRTILNGKEMFFMNLPRKERVATSNLTWVDDKYLLKKKLMEHGLPTPNGGAFISYSAALKCFQKIEKPVIVKPRAGSRGRHTTTLIYTEEDFKLAFKIAKQLCHWVVVEEHLFGDVQRGTVIGGKLIGVLGGSSPVITGDGKHTIAELIKIKDFHRPTRVKEIQYNPYYLQRQGLGLDSILPTGQEVKLSEKIGINYGGTSYDCTGETHPDTKQMLEDAARVLDISIIGFDFIIPDITKSWKEQKCGIIEANGAPFIQLHHDPLIGKSINAAKHVWDLVLETK